MTSTTLRGRSTCDLLAIPAILFGFQPDESVVVLAVSGGRIEFGARLDVALNNRDRAAALHQVEAALRNIAPCRLVVIGFGRDPEDTHAAVVIAARMLGPDVETVLLSNGERYWEVIFPREPLGEGTPYDMRESEIAAQAVFAGLPLHVSRAEAVSAVQPPPLHRRGALAELLDDAGSLVAGLQADERGAELRRLFASGSVLSLRDAALLVCLVQDVDLMWEAFAQLDSDSAAVVHDRLVEARAVAVDSVAPNLLACDPRR